MKLLNCKVTSGNHLVQPFSSKQDQLKADWSGLVLNNLKMEIVQPVWATRSTARPSSHKKCLYYV